MTHSTDIPVSDREAGAALCDTKPTGRRESRRDIDPVVVIDTREQLPFSFTNLRAERGSLVTGDYSLQNMTHLISVERKNLQDLLMCVGTARDRFKRELQRLQGTGFGC